MSGTLAKLNVCQSTVSRRFLLLLCVRRIARHSYARKIVLIHNSTLRLRHTTIAEDGADIDNFLSAEARRHDLASEVDRQKLQSLVFGCLYDRARLTSHSESFSAQALRRLRSPTQIKAQAQTQMPKTVGKTSLRVSGVSLNSKSKELSAKKLAL